MAIAIHNPEVGNLLRNPNFADNASRWTYDSTYWTWSAGLMTFDGSTIPELVTNGDFTGSAAGWTLGARWAYNANNILHTALAGTDAEHQFNQSIGAVEGKYYIVTFSASGASTFRIRIGNNNLGFGVDGVLLVAAGGTYLVKASGNDGKLYMQVSAGYAGTVDSVSVKLCPPLTQVVRTGGETHNATMQATVGAGAGSVYFTMLTNQEVVTPDAASSLKAAGAGVVGWNRSLTIGQSFTVGFFPLPTFTGSIDTTSFTVVKNEHLQQMGLAIQDDTDYTVTLTVGGTVGTISVTLGDDTEVIAAGAGRVSFVAHVTTSEVGGFVITPTTTFDGTVDEITVIEVGGVANLIINGSFNGGFAQWIQGFGWELTGATNNINVFLSVADADGNVLSYNSGTTDNGEDIYFELETRELEFGNRAHLKKIADKMGVITQFGGGTSLEASENGGDWEDLFVDMSTRVTICTDLNLEGNWIVFKWSGSANAVQPVFQGLYLEDVSDMGIRTPES